MAGYVYAAKCPQKSFEGLELGAEIDTGLSGAGTYLLNSSSSGYAALFVVGVTTNSEFLLTKDGLGYSRDENVQNVLWVGRHDRNGNIHVRNNYTSGSSRAFTIRKIESM